MVPENKYYTTYTGTVLHVLKPVLNRINRGILEFSSNFSLTQELPTLAELNTRPCRIVDLYSYDTFVWLCKPLTVI